MNGKVTSTLSSVCTLVTDGTHDTPKTLSEGIPFIKAKQIADGYIDFDNCEYISYEDHLRVISRSKPERGDTLFAHIGATLGAAAYVDTDIEFSIKNVALFKPDPQKIDSHYLYYVILSDVFQNGIKNYRTGAAQPFVSLEILRNQSFTYHEDINTQRKIADVLSAYDDLIGVNTRRISILEQMTQSIYREWFGKVDEKSLPEGWEQKTLGDIAQEIRRSIQPSEIDPETPYFGLEHLPRKSIALSEWGKAGDVKSTKLAFKQGEILFGKIRPYFHKVGVAPLDGVSSTDAIVIVPKKPEYFGITLSHVSSEDFVNHATQTSQGTKMPRANWDVLVKYPIHIPPEDILTKHNEFIRDIVDMIQNLLFANRNLRRTRDLLLPRLVSDEIELKLEQ
jgi:type I restriction enzyme, S subunit